jgi:hypothetical protein
MRGARGWPGRRCSGFRACVSWRDFEAQLGRGAAAILMEFLPERASR